MVEESSKDEEYSSSLDEEEMALFIRNFKKMMAISKFKARRMASQDPRRVTTNMVRMVILL